MRFPMLAAEITRSGSDAGPGWSRLGRILVSATLLAFVAAGAWVATAPSRAIDPDLARVIGFMVLIKAGLTAITLAACHWRLARPTRSWRAAAYVVGPPLMVIGVILLGSLRGLAIGALVFHAALLSVLAAALTDHDVFPDSRLRNR